MAAIGVLTLELRLENSHSLKDKRHVVKSLKDRLRNKFNVAVAEIEFQDLWQRAAVAAVTIASDHARATKAPSGGRTPKWMSIASNAFPKPSRKNSPKSSASK